MAAGEGTTPVDPPPAAEDPIAAWYRDTIQANPGRFDTGRSEAQWRAWYPLWTGSGFRSSKTNPDGTPIQGTFEHPDECPPGTHASGPTNCVPSGAPAPGGGGGAPGGGGAAGGGGGGGGFGGLGGYGAFQYSGGAYPTFEAPDYEALQADPGYQFRLKQGQGALESSAAAKGVLNTGGTLTDIIGYGQDMGSQEYGQAYGRAKDVYGAALGKYTSEYDQWKFKVDDEYRREGLVSGIGWPY